MRRRKTSALFRDKTLVIAVVLSVIAIASLAGVGIYNQAKQQKQHNQNLVDLNELPDSLVADNTKEDSTDTKEAATEHVQAQNYNDQTAVDNTMDATDEVNAQGSESSVQDTTKEDSANDAINNSDTKATDAGTDKAATSGKAKDIKVSFTDKSKMSWPLTGNILLNFSMDKTVYFATLNQYKYNPAVIIQANEDDKVLAAANGKVTAITTKNETGQTVTMDLGNGYTAIYGQLKGIDLEEGDTVEKGSLIGHIEKPSKYYSVEGTNLYFELLKDNKPVNPMSFFE